MTHIVDCASFFGVHFCMVKCCCIRSVTMWLSFPVNPHTACSWSTVLRPNFLISSGCQGTALQQEFFVCNLPSQIMCVVKSQAGYFINWLFLLCVFFFWLHCAMFLCTLLISFFQNAWNELVPLGNTAGLYPYRKNLLQNNVQNKQKEHFI